MTKMTKSANFMLFLNSMSIISSFGFALKLTTETDLESTQAQYYDSHEACCDTYIAQ